MDIHVIIKDYIRYTDCTNFETDWTIWWTTHPPPPPHIYAPGWTGFFVSKTACITNKHENI